MTNILIVDDEEDILDTLAYHLQVAGYDVSKATKGSSAFAELKRAVPDLVLLDRMLPDMNGTEICRYIRSDDHLKEIPILILSALDDEIDRIVGFELGADDYLTKPFSSRELLLRIRAILARSNKRQNEASDKETVQQGVLKLDRQAHRVWVDGREVILTALEFKLLSHFVRAQDRVLERQRLLDEVWNIQADISTRTVDAHVKRLREKLGTARDYIQTVRGVGYRFQPVLT